MVEATSVEAVFHTAAGTTPTAMAEAIAADTVRLIGAGTIQTTEPEIAMGRTVEVLIPRPFPA
jgi:hypothetical protein